MKIQAEMSLYPLKESHVSPYIDGVLNIIQHPDLSISAGPMSTIISGEREDVFQAISDAFAKTADQCQVVLIVKYSNACPRKP
jgi:uncharacterized protein YqgV (UPF0045/DUF77 family)